PMLFRTLAAAAAIGAVLAATACSNETTAPDGGPGLLIGVTSPTSPTPPPPPPSGDEPVESDSVYTGYGNCATGGIDYEVFEYDPDTCTETVVTTDPEACCKGMTSSGDSLP
ncbi:MAG TPA: hypothetical protein VFQ45_13150, partial [Longimicrobium sp.]|nr:hypothetical protein [Longimicrobium sp.]